MVTVTIVGAALAACGGDDTSGACDVFCELAHANCSGTNLQYADVPTCKAACAGFTVDNTLDCRTYHLLVASTGVAADAKTHCPNSIPCQ